MSRTDRLHAYLSTATPRKPKQPTRNDLNGFLRRKFRREMLAMGLIEEKGSAAVFWSYPTALGKLDKVQAPTRSEARALIKEKLGVSKLPPGFAISRLGDAD